jgi:hypothetical protein
MKLVTLKEDTISKAVGIPYAVNKCAERTSGRRTNECGASHSVNYEQSGDLNTSVVASLHQAAPGSSKQQQHL